MGQFRRLSSLKEHRSLLREVFQTARERVLIVSPFISKAALHADGIPHRVRAATERGVKVSIYTDNKLNHVDGSFKRSEMTASPNLSMQAPRY
jgi:phosphatidylserine/phosphatidylglycerophosphate/cardiolipin synthase-like enzyme